ncbi:MAG: hypothetical protein KCHDKBKB_01191 [Elusimicrobia bacterium]|nr:hypothetical protein [Elusimicrobiota bacterium]
MSNRKWLVRGGLLIILVVVGGVYTYLSSRPLAPLLVSINDDERTMALSKLPKLSPKLKSETVQALTQYQNDTNPVVRRYALYGLRQLGEANGDVITFAIRSMTDADPKVREEALAVLYRFGETPIPNLIDVFRKGEGPAVEAAAKVLSKLEGKAVPALVAFINENPPQGKLAAVRTLKLMGKSAKEATPVLLTLFDSQDIDFRLESAEALFELGLLNKSAAPRLGVDLLKSKESYIDPYSSRARLVSLLEKLDPRRRTLVDLKFDLKQKDPVIRYRAAYLISEMNPPNLGAMEMLVDALPDSDVHVSARALAGLTRMGIDKTERIKKRAYPLIKAAVARAQKSNLEGFAPIAEKALQGMK